MAKIRSFIAVEIPFFPSIGSAIEALKSTGLVAKFVEPENMHLTLRFLGDVDERDVPTIVDAMQEAAGDISPFEMKVSGMGFFPGGNRINVIWLGFEGGVPLKDFVSRLSSEFERSNIRPDGMDHREFVPHLTIARVKYPGDKKRLLEVINSYSDTTFGNLSVDKILLKKSVLQRSGPIYSTLASVALR